MTDLERFQQLAARARAESPPPLDVTGSVMQRLAFEERAVLTTQRTLALCSAVSAVAATIVLAVTAWTWSAWTDPLGQMFTQTLTVVQ
ncbi:MAG: hypothetical protein OES79_01405 [Planctomycetota bacterium]|nr:hypothetical protein [Planctomycetota bacterium]